VDSNQRGDEDRLHSDSLGEIHVSDDWVISGLAHFLQARGVSAEAIDVELAPKGKCLRFTTTPGAVGVGLLPLLVTGRAS
jgi:hypothetical protein